MVRRLLQIVKNKIIGNKKETKEENQTDSEKKNWEKRKAELMAKTRQSSSRNNSDASKRKNTGQEKSNQNKQNRGPNRAKKTHGPNIQHRKDNNRRPDTQHKKDDTQRPDVQYKKDNTQPADSHKKDKTQRPDTHKNHRRKPGPKSGPRPRSEFKPKNEIKHNDSAVTQEKEKRDQNWDVKNFDVPVTEGKTRFHDLNLEPELMHSIFEAGFKYCTPIQEAVLKSALEGKDATGRAQTGTGKTAAFLITIINKFIVSPPKGVRRPGAPRALVLAPTRELVMQIAADAKNLTKYSDINVVEIYGGMDFNKQQKRLRSKHVDILVATPGRLLDFQGKRDVFLGSVETLVIDEADRLLDMGFIPDVRKIINSTPSKSKRQTLFFSATLSGEVIRLAQLWTKDPVNVEIEPEKVAGTSVNQIVYIVTNDEKFSLLYNVIQKEKLDRVIVFANRKDEAHPLQEQLKKYGISCEVLSGDVDQKKRIRTLNNFKEGKIRVLVATDVASRGIHVDDISHVINYTLPQDPEDYVHRIGRTGRAGASGTSISFASEDDSFYIPAIEKFLGNKLNCIYPDDKLLTIPEAADLPVEKKENAGQMTENLNKPEEGGGEKENPN